MKLLSDRRFMPACIFAAATVAALAAPGAASASSRGEQCSGSNIEAQGSSLQHLAQIETWNPDFNTSLNATACSGTQGTKGKPTVIYHSTGSGAGLKAFGAEGATPNYKENAFVGTDEAPNATQKTEIESHATGAKEKSLETIPVLQAAVAIIVHLPEGCVGSSEVNKFRIVLNDSTLEGIYRGTINKWSEIKDDSDKLSAESGKTCNAEQAITRVVRQDHSGTTHVFKAYLAAINKTPFEAEAYPDEIGGKATCSEAKPEEEKAWSEIAEGCENQRWPTAAKVVRAKTATGPGLVEEVAATPSSIGYAGLAEVRANGFFTPGSGKGGKDTGHFWVELQNKTEAPITYADPSSNGDVETVANANCANTVYTDGVTEFPPASTRELWNKAQSRLNEENYSLCGLTYDLALREYKPYPETKQKEATTVQNYLLFDLNQGKEGGGALIKNHDFAALPLPVLKLAEKGATEIGY